MEPAANRIHTVQAGIVREPLDEPARHKQRRAMHGLRSARRRQVCDRVHPQLTPQSHELQGALAQPRRGRARRQRRLCLARFRSSFHKPIPPTELISERRAEAFAGAAWAEQSNAPRSLAAGRAVGVVGPAEAHDVGAHEEQVQVIRALDHVVDFIH